MAFAPNEDTYYFQRAPNNVHMSLKNQFTLTQMHAHARAREVLVSMNTQTRRECNIHEDNDKKNLQKVGYGVSAT